MATRKLYDQAGQWVALDGRHGFRREWNGHSTPRWVFRFCDEYVSHHATKREAQTEALKWEIERVSRILRA